MSTDAMTNTEVQRHLDEAIANRRTAEWGWTHVVDEYMRQREVLDGLVNTPTHHRAGRMQADTIRSAQEQLANVTMLLSEASAVLRSTQSEERHWREVAAEREARHAKRAKTNTASLREGMFGGKRVAA